MYDHQPHQHPHHNHYQHVLVLLKTLDYCTSKAPSHVAKIAIVQQDDEDDTVLSDNDDVRNNKLEQQQQQQQQQLSFAQHGQGWSLFGSSNIRTYFICWEGSTLLQGAYVKELDQSPRLPPLSRCSVVCATRVLPLYSTSFDRDSITESRYRSTSSERMMLDVIAGQPGIIIYEGMEQQDDPQQSSSSIVQFPVIKELEQSSLINVNEKEKDEDRLDDYCDVVSPNTNKQNSNGTNMSGTTP